MFVVYKKEAKGHVTLFLKIVDYLSAYHKPWIITILQLRDVNNLAWIRISVGFNALRD